MSRRPAKVIGLIGAIGGGKSTVASRLLERGAFVIDADRVGHEALTFPEVVDRLRGTFGQHIVGAEGQIDRRALAAIVFSDPESLRELERVVHPRMRRVFEERIADAKTSAPLVVLDAAVLLEAKWDDLCDEVWFVSAPAEARLRRLHESRGWSAEELARRENSQMSLDRKQQRADTVLVNDGDLSRLIADVDRLFEERRPPAATSASA